MNEPMDALDPRQRAETAWTEAKRSALRTVEALITLTWMAVIVPLVVLVWRAAW